jgi:predicted dehydrogenase
MSPESDAANSLPVLIVGCGNIAGGFDVGRPAGCLPNTHAGAFAHDGRFKVDACVEPDQQRRDAFMATWSVPVGFRSLDEIPATGMQFDVISICSPTNSHMHDLEVALNLQPKLIFCEKPVTSSIAETESIVDRCDKANIAMAVNYTRRWDPDIIKLRQAITSCQWGELRSVIGLYGKGILNNGSHMLDLLHFLMGPLEIVKVGRPVHDYCSTDPSIPVWLEGSGNIPIQISCAHAEDYAVFELQLVFSLGVLTMEEGGLFWRERRVEDSDVFKGYRKLGEGVRRRGGYPQAMLQAVDNIYRAINNDAQLASTGKTALAAHRICDEIRLQACSGRQVE